MTDGGDGAFGVKQSQETIVKRNLKIIGTHLSKEHKEKLRVSKLGDKNPMFGKEFSEEHRLNLSKSATGRIVSEETREKSRNSQLGKPKNSEMFKKHLSEINSGENHPQFGKKQSIETRSKISKTRFEKTPYKIINIITGEKFKSISEICRCTEYKYDFLDKRLKGLRENNTDYKYIN